MSALRILIAATVLAAWARPEEAAAQQRWTLELSPATGIVTDNPPDFDLRFGFGGEAGLVFRITPEVGLYTGWNWHRFTGDTQDADASVEIAGYAFGVRLEHPIGAAGSPAVMIRLGGSWNHLEFGAGASSEPDSRSGIGWEIGGGLSIPLSSRWTLTPAARYRATRHDVRVGDGTASASLGYALAELGFGLRF